MVRRLERDPRRGASLLRGRDFDLRMWKQCAVGEDVRCVFQIIIVHWSYNHFQTFIFLNITNHEHTCRYDLEFDCLSVDYSAKVIKEMKKMAIKKGKKDMRFQKMDLRDLGEFENERFGTILDKACLDAVRFVFTSY